MDTNPALNAEQNNFVARLDRFCQERFATRAARVDKDAAVSSQARASLLEMNYSRLFHATDMGGLGSEAPVVASALESLAKACGSTYWLATVPSLAIAKLVDRVANPKQRENFLKPLVDGSKFACFGAAESGAGGDGSTYNCAIRKSQTGYVLDGFKARIANSTTAQLGVVAARSTDLEGDRGLRLVLVENMRHPGIRTFRIPTTGLRGMGWGGMVFNNVEVPEENVYPLSFEGIVEFVEWGFVFVSFGAIGIAQAALDSALEFAASRPLRGSPLGDRYAIQRLLASMRVSIDAARLLARRVLTMKMEGQSITELGGLCKVNASEMAIRVTEQALHLQASWGVTEHFVTERLHRDAVTNKDGAAGNEFVRELSGCRLVDEDPYAMRPFDWLSPKGLAVRTAHTEAPGPVPHTRMYADRSATAFDWSTADKSLVLEAFGSGQTERTLSISDLQWDAINHLGTRLGMGVDSLLSQAMASLLRQYKA